MLFPLLKTSLPFPSSDIYPQNRWRMLKEQGWPWELPYSNWQLLRPPKAEGFLGPSLLWLLHLPGCTAAARHLAAASLPTASGRGKFHGKSNSGVGEKKNGMGYNGMGQGQCGWIWSKRGPRIGRGSTNHTLSLSRPTSLIQGSVDLYQQSSRRMSELHYCGCWGFLRGKEMNVLKESSSIQTSSKGCSRSCTDTAASVLGNVVPMGMFGAFY